jgi:hypothetical protein
MFMYRQSCGKIMNCLQCEIYISVQYSSLMGYDFVFRSIRVPNFRIDHFFLVFFMDEPYISVPKLEAASFSERLFPWCQYTRHYNLQKWRHQHHYENIKYVILYYCSRLAIWRKNLKISNI